MRRLLLGLAMVAGISVAALAQPIANCAQLGKLTNGGAQCNSASVLFVGPYKGSSAPCTPGTNCGDQQMWFDTTTATPTCKYADNGSSSWKACSTYSTMTTQTDLSSFPGSPTDGQFFMDWSHNVIWTYHGATSTWCNTFGSCTGSAVVDNFTGSTITAPATAPTLTDGGAGGNMTSGTHMCSVQYANSTGGETTPGSSATSSVSITASHKITLTSIPTGGAGTSARRIYCSKAGTTSPKYWLDTIADNSTTSLTSSGLADANLIVRETDTNYSGALPSGWGMTNSTSITNAGGCGVTGSALICRTSGVVLVNTGTTETGVIGYRDLTTWTGGDYTIEYRLTRVEGGPAQATATSDGTAGGWTVGTSFSSGPIAFYGNFTTSQTFPLSSTVGIAGNYRSRATAGGSSSNVAQISNYIFPRITALPLYVRLVKKGHLFQIYYANASKNWTSMYGTSGGTSINPADNAIAFNPSSDFDTFIINATASTSDTSARDLLIAIDSFTLTVN